MAVRMLLLLAVAASFGWADDAPWTLIRSRDGIDTYESSRVEDGYREFRGVMRLEATFEETTTVIKDIPGSVHWLPACRRSDEIERRSDRQVLVYVVNNAPWPFRDRECLWLRDYVVDTDEHMLMHYHATREDFDSEPGMVRMVNARGVWEVTRLGETSVEVRFQFVGDGGGVPKAFMNGTNRKLPHRVLTALVRRIEELREE
jgi:hypothetical protein